MAKKLYYIFMLSLLSYSATIMAADKFCVVSDADSAKQCEGTYNQGDVLKVKLDKGARVTCQRMLIPTPTPNENYALYTEDGSTLYNFQKLDNGSWGGIVPGGIDVLSTFGRHQTFQMQKVYLVEGAKPKEAQNQYQYIVQNCKHSDPFYR